MVSVDSVDTSHPQIDTDESYTLTIAGDGSDATINAKNVSGAMRGLETFAQLVSFEYDTQSYMLPAGSILLLRTSPTPPPPSPSPFFF